MRVLKLLFFLFLFFQTNLYAAKVEIELTSYTIDKDPSQEEIKDEVIGDFYFKFQKDDDWVAAITGDPYFIRNGSSGTNTGDHLNYTITFVKTDGLNDNKISNVPENTSFSSTPHYIYFSKKGKVYWDIELSTAVKPELLSGTYNLNLIIELIEEDDL